MKILITGSHGLIGSTLAASLTARGHQVIRMVRPGSESSEHTVEWNPNTGKVDASALEQTDAVVHLAGENIAAGRWTAERKNRIRESRVQGTRLLSEALAGLAHPPRVLVSASAIGYYGSRGEEALTEASAPGTGFLPELCIAWEAATEPARRKGIRVVNLRYGMVLSAKGGALAKMLPVFKMGAGGKIGSGRQFISWVALDDVIGAIQHVISTQSMSGPVNVVAPNPVRNAEFTEALGKALGRPTVFTVPQFVARLAFGEMADAALLSSTRVQPNRLLANGFTFLYPEINGVLRAILGKN